MVVVVSGLCWSEAVLVSNGDGAMLAITNKSCCPLFVAGIGLEGLLLHIEKGF